MKRIAVMLLITAAMMSGCNKQVIDTTYNFKHAVIALPDGTIVDGRVQSWTDYDNGDMIQVKVDGKTYMTHSCNVVLIAD